ncbi:hypothetical protein AB0H92_02150 [Streptomyces phaeochromogenes]
MRRGVFEIDGAELYYEVRGDGPALLLISGAGAMPGISRGSPTSWRTPSP